jgi:hypothetical protein
MATVKEGNKQRSRYAWFIMKLMEDKEQAARDRLVELQKRQEHLKPIYRKYLELYKLHIHPLMKDITEFTDNGFEMRKCEHFLQGQAEHRANEELKAIDPKGTRSWTLPPQVQRLPYAGKSQVGRKPKLLNESDAKDALQKLKEMDQGLLAKLLEEIK